LFFTTNAENCTAFINIADGVNVTDNCSEVTSLIGFIYPDGDLNNLPLGPFDANNFATNIPKGDHLLRYVASDACGNGDTLDVEITVGDATAPVAIAEDGINVSLGGTGTAILMAEDVDLASYDECADELLLEIVRVDENNFPLGDWMPSLTLTCADIGTLRVGLRVTDDGNMNGINEPGIDNSNQTFTVVLVEDLSSPICIAPSSLTITCNDLDNEFPEDLNTAFAADPEGIGALLNDLFGTANGIDNCPEISIDQSVVDNRTGCGNGIIQRSFGVTDAQGFTSIPNCNQSIQVVGSFDYSIVFPADQDSENCIEPDFNDIQIVGGSCNLITVGTRIDTFAATADECFLLRITYEVIDLCEYSTTAAPYPIPRDADNDGIVGETVVVHVTPGVTDASISDDVAVLDRDLNRNNGNSIANLDTGDGGLVAGTNVAGYGQDESRGAFIYSQFVSVNDNIAPQLNIDNTDTLAMDTNGDCVADIAIDFTINDECSMDNVTFLVDVDFFINDLNNDGFFTNNEYIPTQAVSPSNILNIGEGSFRASLQDLPIGQHALRVRVSDGCGNSSVQIRQFRAEDASGPTISCINGLTATLSADENGDGIAQVTARNFVVDIDNVNDCSGPLNYAIYRVSESNQAGFMPDAADTLLTVTCEDLGALPIRVYGIDPVGMTSFCETILSVQVFNDNVCNDGGQGNLTGTIAGIISTPLDEMREGVEVNVTASEMGDFLTFTADNGSYVFQNLMEGDDYTVQPEANPGIDVGAVTTGDLILLSRHILNLEPLSSPYQYVAADVTDDGLINVLDIITIRRVILGLAPEYPNSNSWRFVSALHNFGNSPDQWLSNNPSEVYNINNLVGNMLSANFSAIEMGNVSGQGPLENNLDAGPVGRSSANLQLAQLSFDQYGYFEVPITRPNDLMGFQTTLEILPGLEFVGIEYGSVQAEDLNLEHSAEGLIGISHVAQAEGDEHLFTLQLRALEKGQLVNYLALSDRVVTTEAYVAEAASLTVRSLDLDFKVAELLGSSQVELTQLRVAQNRPNPFSQQTQIDYYLPTSGPVSLEIYNAQGQQVLSHQWLAVMGQHTLTLNQRDLKGATGVLSYRLTAGAESVSKKMLVTN
ncbi:MAG: T9SS type A sorting domain-containing protein, partial [Bacteroidota bacterium]